MDILDHMDIFGYRLQTSRYIQGYSLSLYSYLYIQPKGFSAPPNKTGNSHSRLDQGMTQQVHLEVNSQNPGKDNQLEKAFILFLRNFISDLGNFYCRGNYLYLFYASRRKLYNHLLHSSSSIQPVYYSPFLYT